MTNTVFLIIFLTPFIVLGWYLLSRISLGRYRIVDHSYTSYEKKRVPLMVLEYLSPVGWQETVAGRIPGDGWTYTVEWPYSFHGMKEAKAFCKKNRIRLNKG